MGSGVRCDKCLSVDADREWKQNGGEAIIAMVTDVSVARRNSARCSIRYVSVARHTSGGCGFCLSRVGLCGRFRECADTQKGQKDPSYDNEHTN